MCTVAVGLSDRTSGPFVSVKVISASENASASFDYGLGNSIVENPLVDAANGLDAHVAYDHISVSVLKNNGKNVTHYPEDLDSILVTAQHQKNPSRYYRSPSFSNSATTQDRSHHSEMTISAGRPPLRASPRLRAGGIARAEIIP